MFLLIFTPAQDQLDGQQVKTGTAVVILFSHNYIVFAAESRVVLAGKSIRHRDDACKVRAISNKFIFASAGVNGFEPEPGKNGNAWSAYDEPGKLADQLPDMDNPVHGLAELWGKSLEKQVNRALAVNPEPMMDFLRHEGGQTLSSGIFAGRTKQGQLVVYKADLNCNCVGNSRRTSLEILPLPLPASSAGLVIGSQEALDLWDELKKGNSERARASLHQFETDHASGAGPKTLGAAAVTSLEFIVKYAREEGIGGPIDAVEMTPAGDTYWIQRKANCPDQQ
ncbi:MAG TPA: hypothetical protein VFR24_21170 [Candidatus Angelobacter sp.]|nr:hypothetical protein [Candidatus Angelobacter sp.]